MLNNIPAEHLSFAAQFLKKYEEEKKIRVYFIESTENDTGRACFFYVVASALLHDKMVRCLADGDIPDFAVIVEKGYGRPTPDIKAKIREYYGFDHDIDENDDVTPIS